MFVWLLTSIAVIQARYGSGVIAYFRVFRWVTLNMGLLMLMWLPSLVIHIFLSSNLLSVDGYYPVLFRYSDFATVLLVLLTRTFVQIVCLICCLLQGEGNLYAATLMIFLFYQAAACVYQLVQEDKLQRETKLLETDETIRYAKPTISSLWDWSSIKQDEIEDAKLTVSDTFQLLTHEEELAMIIKVWLFLFPLVVIVIMFWCRLALGRRVSVCC